MILGSRKSLFLLKIHFDIKAKVLKKNIDIYTPDLADRSTLVHDGNPRLSLRIMINFKSNIDFSSKKLLGQDIDQ